MRALALRKPAAPLFFAFALLLFAPTRIQAEAKGRSVVLGSIRVVPYSAAGDPSGAQPGETRLRVRPLLVGGKEKEWTTGESHAVTDRSFVIRRALRLNDALPSDKTERWVWQRGPWLLVDRVTGAITALRLPDYDPAVSIVVWFRDYAAYCGLTASGRQLYAVVAQISARKPILAKKIASWPPAGETRPACAPALWQRDPLRVTFQQTGGSAISYGLVGLSAVLVEDGDGNNAAAPDQ